MTRFGKSSHASFDIFDVVWGWLLPFVALGAFFIVMARTKKTTPGSPPTAGTGSSNKTEEADPSGKEQMKKRKNNPRTESID